MADARPVFAPLPDLDVHAHLHETAAFAAFEKSHQHLLDTERMCAHAADMVKWKRDNYQWFAPTPGFYTNDERMDKMRQQQQELAEAEAHYLETLEWLAAAKAVFEACTSNGGIPPENEATRAAHERYDEACHAFSVAFNAEMEARHAGHRSDALYQMMCEADVRQYRALTEYNKLRLQGAPPPGPLQ